MTLQTQLRLIAAIALISQTGVIVFAVTQLHRLQGDFSDYQASQIFSRNLAEIKSEALTISRADPILPETGKRLEKADHDIQTLHRELARLHLADADNGKVQQIEVAWSDYARGLFQTIKIAETSPVDALQMPDMLYASKLEPMIHDIDSLTEANRAGKIAAEASIQHSLDRILWIVVLPLVFAGLMIVVFQAVFNRRLKNRVDEVLVAMNHLVAGNLTHRLTGNHADEFGTMSNTINTFITRFEKILGEVNFSAGQTLQTTDRVSLMAQTVSQNAQLQSEKVASVSTSIQEMHRSATDIAGNADQAAKTAQQTRKQVQEGARVGQETIDTLTRLDDTMCASTEKIDGLNQALLQIDSISNIIKGIAEQTKLLALNAAIEAARAGEHGRGFAVVADEVRTLSDRTTSSAIEISRLLNAVQTSAGEAVDAMRVARGEVQSSAKHGGRISSVLGEIETSMQLVAEMMQQIA